MEQTREASQQLQEHRSEESLPASFQAPGRQLRHQHLRPALLLPHLEHCKPLTTAKPGPVAATHQHGPGPQPKPQLRKQSGCFLPTAMWALFTRHRQATLCWANGLAGARASHLPGSPAPSRHSRITGCVVWIRAPKAAESSLEKAAAASLLLYLPSP